MKLTLNHFIQVTHSSCKLILVAVIFVCSINAANGQFWSNNKPDLLPEEEAFSVIAEIQNGVLKVNWSIADDYYMSVSYTHLTLPTKRIV